MPLLRHLPSGRVGSWLYSRSGSSARNEGNQSSATAMSVERCQALSRCLSSAAAMSAERCQALPRCLSIATDRRRSLSIAVDRCRPLSRAILAPAEGEVVPQRDFWGLVNERWDGGAELLASGARGAWGRTAGGCLRSLCFAHRTGRAVDDRLGPTCSGTCSAAPASRSGGPALPGGACCRAGEYRAGGSGAWVSWTRGSEQGKCALRFRSTGRARAGWSSPAHH